MEILHTTAQKEGGAQNVFVLAEGGGRRGDCPIGDLGGGVF